VGAQFDTLCAHLGLLAAHGPPLMPISLADDGVGFGQSSAGTGLGLANARDPLVQLHGERAARG
jgi:hypothetical protein